jgi:hypothetical protein
MIIPSDAHRQEVGQEAVVLGQCGRMRIVLKDKRFKGTVLLLERAELPEKSDLRTLARSSTIR